MRNDEVRKYYDILNKKQCSLLVKRIFDIAMSFLLLVILSPVFLILSIWIKLDSEGTVFYRQERITQYGKTFRIFKFRTMIANADQMGALITSQNDARITKVGEKIRKCRLDEIPQLINILLGDMSFVGARPEVRKYVDAYTDEMKATLLLPAGVTSLASIRFKDEDEILTKYMGDDYSIDDIYINKILEKKMKYNLDYLNKNNLHIDIKLCLQTLIER